MVWDRLWKARPTDSRDDQLLARERRHPRWQWILGQVEASFGSCAGLETIELGAGRGDLSAILAERGAKVTLLDASDRALDQARRRFRRLGLAARFERADLFSIPHALLDRFHVALSSGVIEHFQGAMRTRAVDAHRRVLGPGGLTVISVPHTWGIPYRLWKFYCELRRCWPYGMEVPYSRGELTARFQAAGLTRTDAALFGFWQSVGDHLCRSIFGTGPDWAACPSRLDRLLGATLVVSGRRDDWRAPRVPACESTDETALVERHFLRRGSGPEFDMEADWFRRYLPREPGPVLDLGCGNGALLSALGPVQAVGVDLNAIGLALTLRHRPHLTLVCGEAARLPVADGSLKAILAQHVIEHVEDAAAACREWFRALRSGGVLLIVTPNGRFPDPALYDDPTHHRIFDSSGLRGLLAAAGFEVFDLRTLGAPWFHHQPGRRGWWRLRRFVTRRAVLLSNLPGLRWGGQSLCCAARKPI
jgi:SAM-dependent methyltransferase